MPLFSFNLMGNLVCLLITLINRHDVAHALILNEFDNFLYKR